MAEKSTRRRISREIRQDIVKLVISGGRKCGEVAAEHQVPIASVYAWVRQARAEVGTGLSGEAPTLATVQADNARLRKELKVAKDHALFLRKTAAFFASERK